MLFFLAVIRFALVSRASSQSTTVVEILPYPTSCPNSFLEANATGSASIGLPSLEEPFTWVYAVSDNTSNAAFENLWLGLPPGINLSNLPDNYGLCTIQLTLSPNTIERGQMDEGFCEQTLDQACIDILVTTGAYTANKMLTDIVSIPVMPLFCEQLVPAIVTAAKSATCEPYFYNQFNFDSNSNSLEPTGNGNCINDAYPNMTFASFQNILPNDVPLPTSGSNAFYNYDSAYRDVKTILTTFVALSTSSTATLQSYINCVRITNTSPGSRVAPALLSPTAVTLPSSLVGDVPIFFAGLPFPILIIMGILYLLRKLKRCAREVALRSAYEKTKDNGIMIDGNDIFEVAADIGRSGRAELKGQAIAEMQGTDVQNMLPGDDQAPELAPEI